MTKLKNGDIKKEKLRSEFHAATDAKLRFFWVAWTILAVICFASLTISLIALKQVRDLKKAQIDLPTASSATESESQLSTPITTADIPQSESLEGRYEVLSHNLTILSKKYIKMYRSMKEMLEEHERSPTGHASGSIKVEITKLRADFNDILKKYVKRKGNKFLKISNYEKSSKEIRGMVERLDSVVNNLLEEVKSKLGVAHLEKEAIRLGFVKSDLNGIRKSGSSNNCVRASELALFVKTELGPYVRMSQMDSIFKQSNFTLWFTQQLNELKRSYMTKRSAKTYVDMQAHESREELVVRLNENTRTRLQFLQDNINSRIGLMHKDLQLLTSVLSPKDDDGGACSEQAHQVLTSLSGHFEPGAWDLGNAEKRVDMVRRFRQLQEDFFQNQTEQMSIVHDQRLKLEQGLQQVSKLYADMDSSIQNGMNTIRLQIQQNARELERISETSEDLSRRQKQTQSGLNTFKTASYRMMATKADFEALTQQAQQTKVGLRELRDIQIRSLSKDVNELKENEMKYLKFQVVQMSQRMQEIQKVSDSVQNDRFQAGQNTLTEMESLSKDVNELKEALTSLFEEVQGSGAKEALGT